VESPDVEVFVANIKASAASREKAAMPFTTFWRQALSWSRLTGPDSESVRDLVPAVVAATAELEAVQRLRRHTGDEISEAAIAPTRRALGSVNALWALVDVASTDSMTVGLVPVAAYYAAYHGLVAAREAERGRLKDHAAAGAHAAYMAGRGLLPAPFDLVAVGSGPTTFKVRSGLGWVKPFAPTVPSGKHITEPSTDAIALDRVGQALMTTRREGRTPDYKGARRAGKPAKHDTTFVDWLFKLRHRAQYQDVDPFTVGVAADLDLRDFAHALAWDATAFVTATLASTAMRLTVSEVAEVKRRVGVVSGKKAFAPVVATALLTQRKA